MKKRQSVWASLGNLIASRSRDPQCRRRPRKSRRPRFELFEPRNLLAADLALDISDGDVSVEAGDTIVYTFDYANEGEMDATGTTIRATVPRRTTFDAAASDAAWTCTEAGFFFWESTRCTLEIGDLASGASGSAAFAIAVDAELSAHVRRIAVSGHISADGEGRRDPSFWNNFAYESTPILRELHDLRLEISDGDGGVSPGDTIVYTLDYTNAGVVGATGAAIKMKVPRHTTFDAGASSAGWACGDDGSCTLDVGDVDVDQGGTATFAVNVDAELSSRVRRISTAARISDDGTGDGDANRWNNFAFERTSVVHSVPDLSLRIDDGDTDAAPGDTVTYTLNYSNNGIVDASGAVITVRLSRHASFAAEASSAGWECADGVCTLEIGDVATGAGGSVTLVVTVNADVSADVRRVYAIGRIADDGSNGHDGNRLNNFAFARTRIVHAGGEEGGLSAPVKRFYGAAS